MEQSSASKLSTAALKQQYPQTFVKKIKRIQTNIAKPVPEPEQETVESQLDPRVILLRKMIRAEKNKLRNLEKKISVLREKKQKNFQKDGTVDDFKKLCETFLPPSCVDFVKVQASVNQQSGMQRRYGQDYLNTMLNIYLTGGNAYNTMSEIFTLPSKKTLLRLKNQLKQAIQVTQVDSDLNEEEMDIIEIIEVANPFTD